MNDELTLIAIALVGGFTSVSMTLNEVFSGDVGFFVLMLPVWTVILGGSLLVLVSDDEETPAVVNNIEPTFEFPEPPNGGGRR